MKTHYWLKENQKVEGIQKFPEYLSHMGVEKEELEKQASFLSGITPQRINVAISILQGAYDGINAAFSDNDSLAEALEENLAGAHIHFILTMIWAYNPNLFILQ